MQRRLVIAAAVCAVIVATSGGPYKAEPALRVHILGFEVDDASEEIHVKFGWIEVNEGDGVRSSEPHLIVRDLSSWPADKRPTKEHILYFTGLLKNPPFNYDGTQASPRRFRSLLYMRDDTLRWSTVDAPEQGWFIERLGDYELVVRRADEH